MALQRVVHRCEEVPGIECSISQELKGTTMDFIGSGFSHDIDNAARSIPVFSREITGLEIEFLDRIGIRKWQIHIEVGIVMTGPIQLVIDLTRPAAINPGRLLSWIDASMAILPAVSLG